MKIEQKTIIINSENIEEYQKVQYLASGEYVPKWNALGDISPSGNKVILYQYHIDPSLNLPKNHILYTKTQNANYEMPFSYAHEIQHSYNENIGFKFELIERLCYTYIVLFLMDELSARTAANLIRIKQDLKNQHSYKELQLFGFDLKDQALFLASGLFDEQDMCLEYAYNGALSYACCFNALIKKESKKYLEEILYNQILWHKDYKDHQKLYTPKLFETATKYFEFNQKKPSEKFNPLVKQALAESWEKINPKIFDVSRQCLMRLQQNLSNLSI